jgi:hypothetical protein
VAEDGLLELGQCRVQLEIFMLTALNLRVVLRVAHLVASSLKQNGCYMLHFFVFKISALCLQNDCISKGYK